MDEQQVLHRRPFMQKRDPNDGPAAARRPRRARCYSAGRAMDAARFLRTWLPLAAALLLAACATRPPPSRDGPEASPPSGLERVPDAEPRIEPLRSGGPNKPYEVLGAAYVPLAGDAPLKERGLASWYGRKFHGRPTASGEPYDMYAMTAAHKTMPIPSYARVRNPANGREVIVRVNDRGPFAAGRIIDLSYTAALKLGVLAGVAPVTVERITHDEIRAGLWRRERPQPPAEPARGVADDPLIALVDANAANEGSGNAPGDGWWLQLGAFRQRDGAAQLQQRVRREAPGLVSTVAISSVANDLFRVHVGPYGSRDEALGFAERLRALLQLVPVLVAPR
jgi:rare lipoprotein A